MAIGSALWCPLDRYKAAMSFIPSKLLEILVACFFLLLSSATAASLTSCAAAKNCVPATTSAQCGIYFAPSTIPGAGMGMFAGSSYKEDDIMTPGDIVIPITDFQAHNSDVSIEQIVLQSYYWLSWAFNGMPEESMDSFAFAPGIGAAINCFFPLVNTQGYDDATLMDNSNLHRSRDPGAGGFTPFHGRFAYALRDIQAGEELFTDYGEDYFTNNQESFGLIPVHDSYPSADHLIRQYVSTRNNVTRSHNSNIHNDFYNLISDLRTSVWPSRTLNALPKDPNVVDEIAEIGTSLLHYNRSIRSVDWLEEHGMCMDHLEAKTSTIPQAGRGAFARRFLPKRSLVGPAPMVHLDSTVLNMYHLYPVKYGGFKGDVEVDLDADPTHEQLLLNYCFGHRQSSIVMCPYGMGTGLINHSPNANVRIEWNRRYMRNPEWLNMPVDEWIAEDHVGLMINFVALRDIQEGEEVLLDYGADWEAAWKEHVATWKPPPGSSKYIPSCDLNGDVDLLVRTKDEGVYPGVETLCLEYYRREAGLEEMDEDEHPCRAILRTEYGGDELRYVVEVYERSEDDAFCYEEAMEVLFGIPRDAFTFRDFPYSRDVAQPWSFRHSIGFPDDLMPPLWKDLK